MANVGFGQMETALCLDPMESVLHQNRALY